MKSYREQYQGYPNQKHFNFLSSKKLYKIKFPIIKLFVLGAAIIFYSHSIAAQTVALQKSLNEKISGSFESVKPLTAFDTTTESVFGNEDSLFSDTKPKLLPANLSLMENFLWSENGVVRKMGIVSPLSPDEREHELGIRRFMLTTHQIGGFTTLALMLSADYFGQRVIDGKRYLGDTHQQLITATIIAYGATALLAVLSPPPLIRRDEESTTTLHKTLAWIHVAGMIVTPILGSMIGGRRSFNIDKAHYHQIAGYLTTAIFATSMIVVTF